MYGQTELLTETALETASPTVIILTAEEKQFTAKPIILCDNRSNYYSEAHIAKTRDVG
jgi:hypothetical protein